MLENDTTEPLTADNELRAFTPDDVATMLGSFTNHELAVAQLVELREVRLLLARFAQLGDMMAQLGSSPSMFGRLLGLGGNG